MGEVILRRIGDKSYAEPSSPEKAIEAKIDPPAVLGRGQTLKCPEKKVSRYHATIDWDDDGVLITATHTNPTFIIIKGKEKTLSQGQSAVLKDGDRFGLLKEAYWYKVILKSVYSSVKEEATKNADAEGEPVSENVLETAEDTPSTGSTSSGTIPSDNVNDLSIVEDRPAIEEINYSNDSKKDVRNSFHSNSNRNKSSAEPKDKTQNIENLSDKTTSLNEDDERILEVSAAVNSRERVLPKWLTSSKMTDSNENVLNKAAGVSHGAKKVKMPKLPKPKPKPRQKVLEYSDASESENEQKTLPKRGLKVNKGSPQKRNKPSKKPNQYHTLSQDLDTPEMDTEISESKVPTSKKPASDRSTSPKRPTNAAAAARKPAQNAAPRDNLHSVSDDDEESPFKNRKKVVESERKRPTTVKDSFTKDNADNSSENANKKMKTSRKSCEYGENCYRKNPKHRKEMAHPGDADYTSSEDNPGDDNDDRPECEFGLNCFRKNPQHKKDFKHTAVLNPPRQAKRKAKREGYDNEDNDDDSENEYDFEDPFLNDDSSDDYAPTDSSGRDSDIEEAVEERDTKRMMKEAKKFVKKRKH